MFSLESHKGVYQDLYCSVIFINNLPQHIKSATPFVFSDDTKCLLAIRSTHDIDKLQSDVNSTAMWSHSTDLLFNETIFADLNSTTYTINGKPIRQFSQHKDLGVIFTSNLDWTDHYRTITTKAYQM